MCVLVMHVLREVYCIGGKPHFWKTLSNPIHRTSSSFLPFLISSKAAMAGRGRPSGTDTQASCLSGVQTRRDFGRGVAVRGSFGGQNRAKSAMNDDDDSSILPGFPSLSTSPSGVALSPERGASIPERDGHHHGYDPESRMRSGESSTGIGRLPSERRPLSNAQSSHRQYHAAVGEEEHWEPRLHKEKVKIVRRKQDFHNGSRGLQGGASETTKEDRIYFLGRLLTSILRHRASELNIPIRNDGYVAVKDLLNLHVKIRTGLPLSVFTVDDVLKAVERDNKQRFGLMTENDILYIRANQGHSMKIIESSKLLKRVFSANEIPVCVHGTFMKNLEPIMKEGLKKMGRNHIHFASGLPKEDGVISGMRAHCEVLIYLNVEQALKDGMEIYISENGVILTEGFGGIVPPNYFARVASFKNGKVIPIGP